MGTRKGVRKRTAKTTPRKKHVPPKVKQVTFQWTVTEANAVTVVGDFNRWDPHAHPARTSIGLLLTESGGMTPSTPTGCRTPTEASTRSARGSNMG